MKNISFLPIAFAIPYQDPADVLLQLADEPYLCFLDSAQSNSDCGRYSFICFDPFLTFKSKGEQVVIADQTFDGDPLQLLQQQLDKYQTATIENMPPFQGGAAGYFAYELLQQFERVDVPTLGGKNDYDINLGFYDVVISFDHVEQSAFIISQGLPELDYVKRIQRADMRMQQVLAKLKQQQVVIAPAPTKLATNIARNFSRNDYEKMVAKIIEYIRAGDIFQANMTQQFTAIKNDGVANINVYRRLRASNPAPFAAYLDFGDITIASSSPERFLSVQDRIVDTRPVKGTIKRSNDKVADAELKEVLATSEKDVAENTMIVDLMRNDLSRVCLDDSVEVLELCAVKTFATVHHLVSTIRAKLAKENKLTDLLRATFPGGSITGAPKIRAMEIIAELEQTPRGPYCGSIAYLGFDGSMDSSIVIRTIVIRDDVITFNAGGAVVVDSDPAAEYQESITKAAAPMAILNKEESLDFTN